MILYVFYMYFLIYPGHVWDFRLCFQPLVRQKSSLGSHAPALESRDLALRRSIHIATTDATCCNMLPNWWKDREEFEWKEGAKLNP